jgi:hypothetical protein
MNNNIINFTVAFMQSVINNSINAVNREILESRKARKDADGYYVEYKGVRIGLGSELVTLKGITEMIGNEGARFHCMSRKRLATFGMTQETLPKEEGKTGVNTQERHIRSLELRTGIKCPWNAEIDRYIHPTPESKDWKQWIAVVNILYPQGIPVDVVDNPNDPTEKNVQFAGSSTLEILEKLADDEVEGMSKEDHLKDLLGDHANIDPIDEAVEDATEVPTAS